MTYKPDPMREVVGVMVGSVIYPHARFSGEPITRARMRFMAACDLGEKWEQWARAPTLFMLASPSTASKGK
jgi:hypothetical protein